jgi:hypothetical protein
MGGETMLIYQSGRLKLLGTAGGKYVVKSKREAR